MQQPKEKTSDEQILLTIAVTRKKRKVHYKVHCAKEVKSQQLAHYLDEIIEGICTWKPGICEEAVESIIEPLNNPSKKK